MTHLPPRVNLSAIRTSIRHNFAIYRYHTRHISVEKKFSYRVHSSITVNWIFFSLSFVHTHQRTVRCGNLHGVLITGLAAFPVNGRALRYSRCLKIILRKMRADFHSIRPFPFSAIGTDKRISVIGRMYGGRFVRSVDAAEWNFFSTLRYDIGAVLNDYSLRDDSNRTVEPRVQCTRNKNKRFFFSLDVIFSILFGVSILWRIVYVKDPTCVCSDRVTQKYPRTRVPMSGRWARTSRRLARYLPCDAIRLLFFQVQWNVDQVMAFDPLGLPGEGGKYFGNGLMQIWPVKMIKFELWLLNVLLSSLRVILDLDLGTIMKDSMVVGFFRSGGMIFHAKVVFEVPKCGFFSMLSFA